MQSQHYNRQNKFNYRISDTNNNKLFILHFLLTLMKTV